MLEDVSNTLTAIVNFGSASFETGDTILPLAGKLGIIQSAGTAALLDAEIQSATAEKRAVVVTAAQARTISEGQKALTKNVRHLSKELVHYKNKALEEATEAELASELEGHPDVGWGGPEMFRRLLEVGAINQSEFDHKKLLE